MNHLPPPPNSYSHDPNDYEILKFLPSSGSSTTHKARYIKSGTLLTIKVFHNYMAELEDNYNLYGLITLAKNCINHPNIIGVHCTFKHEDQLWIVMPFFELESLNSKINSSFSSGLSEAFMAFILEETLKAIQHIHEHSYIHEMIDLDHVFVADSRDVKLDLGLLSYNNEETSVQRSLWMAAPDLKSFEKMDIWMVGLLVMELFYGKVLTSGPQEYTRLVSRINSRPKKPSFVVKLFGGCFSPVHSSGSERLPSRSLGEVMALSLDPDQLKRPTAKELLKHEFFRKSHDHK